MNDTTQAAPETTEHRLTDLSSSQRLRAAAEILRAEESAGAHLEHAALFNAVACWLESTAECAGYTGRGVDTANAHRVADVVLSEVAMNDADASNPAGHLSAEGPAWIDDGHQVTVTLDYGQFAFAVICPSDGVDLGGRLWPELPACRRVLDEDGQPQPDESPASECYLARLGKEFVADEFFDGAAPVFEAVSPFAVEYRFEGWDSEAVYVRPKQAAEPASTTVARPRETLVHLHFIDPDTQDRSTWIGTCEHRALLRNADGRRVLEVMIDVDTAPQPAVPVRGFRVGDLVQITGRDDEFDSPRGMQLNGRTGHITELDPGADYPIGLTVEDWLGLVWCNSGEIRHADAVQDAPVESAGSAL